MNIPIGNSALSIRHLASISAQSTNRLPSRAESGMIFLWSVPIRMRDICGVISPTKPIIPHFATSTPVIIDINSI